MPGDSPPAWDAVRHSSSGAGEAALGWTTGLEAMTAAVVVVAAGAGAEGCRQATSTDHRRNRWTAWERPCLWVVPREWAAEGEKKEEAEEGEGWEFRWVDLGREGWEFRWLARGRGVCLWATTAAAVVANEVGVAAGCPKGP